MAVGAIGGLSNKVQAQWGNLPFGQALEQMKGGRRIARRGWNGAGQFVFLNLGSDPSNPTERAGCLSGIPSGLFAFGDCGTSRRMPNAVLSTADGASVPWVPSQTDMLAEDWRVL
jgi:hypothetical protein